MTLVCIGLAIWTHRAREQRRIVEHVRRATGVVSYDYEDVPVHVGESPQSPVPQWLLDTLGVDYFHSVTEVGIEDPALLPKLSRLWRLERLVVEDDELSDDDLAPIAELTALKSIHISMGDTDWPVSGVGDRTMAVIGELPRLESAWVTGTLITPAGTEALSRSQSLRRVNVACTDPNIDGAAAEPFRRAGRVNYVAIEKFTSEGREIVAEWADWDEM